MAVITKLKMHIPLILAFLLLRTYYSKLLAQIHTHTHTQKDGHSRAAYSRKKVETTSKSFSSLMVKYIHTVEYYTTFKTVIDLLVLFVLM